MAVKSSKYLFYYFLSEKIYRQPHSLLCNVDIVYWNFIEEFLLHSLQRVIVIEQYRFLN